MADNALLELIGKNYTGDALGYEKEIVSVSSILKENIEKVTTVPLEAIIPERETEKEEKKEAPKKDEKEANTSTKITKEEADDMRQGEKDYRDALAFIKDAIAPSMMKVDATKVQIGDVYARTFFTYAYPDFLE
jgi:anti-sigma28 factor (negative regulator of flagellin synthesis)